MEDLLKKSDQPDGVPSSSSYRPHCLLNNVDKILEFLIAWRLEEHIENNGGLFTNQYGFRKGKSTDHVVCELHNTVVQGVNDGKFGLAISIDIRNAFNSIK